MARKLRIGYPMLKARGGGPRKAGVRFHDLTGIYASTRGDVALDACCHFNQRGIEIMARQIGRRINQGATSGATPR